MTINKYAYLTWGLLSADVLTEKTMIVREGESRAVTSDVYTLRDTSSTISTQWLIGVYDPIHNLTRFEVSVIAEVSKPVNPIYNHITQLRLGV